MKFLKSVLATIIGLIIFSFLSFGLFVLIASAGEEKVKVKPNSVLLVSLNKEIKERAIDDPFAELFPGDASSPIGLKELKRAINHAKYDDKIKGILLKSGRLNTSFAMVEEIRKVLNDFKESGKFIVSYDEYFNEGGYYVSTIADDIYINKDWGIVEFNGLSTTTPYFKKTFEKLDIEPVIFKVGNYKSATEPFTETEMSDYDRKQTEELLASLYNNMMGNIASDRGIELDELKRISEEGLIREDDDAVTHKLVDGAIYEDQVFSKIKENLGIEEEKKLDFISFTKYNKSFDDDFKAKDRVAVLVSEGNIVTGSGDGETIGDDKFVKELRKLVKNSRVKAIVLRINSPGGSALASDVMWREIQEASKKKPVIASMSGVAASGGYYMAMGCDTIVASKSTITGSIGIFSMTFNLGEMFDNKLGITFDGVKTGKYSDIATVVRELTEEEKMIYQKGVENGYNIFTSKAAAGRNMDVEKLREFASGRVWTGEQALEHGLIDAVGELEDAIDIAAEKAGLEEYRVKYYPEQKPFIEQLLSELSGESETYFMKLKYGELYPYVKQLKELQKYEGLQTIDFVGNSVTF